jgi:putative ABC transport system ATP-binding protein
MTHPLIEIEEVSVNYGTGPAMCQALRDVSLTVNAGEVLLMMGPSGSGKTTLTQVLGCLLPPTTGRVRLFGDAVEHLDQRALGEIRLRHYGFVFQGYNLFPTLRAWENVALALDLVGIRGAEAERRSHELLGEVGLALKANTYPVNLSGGERQRVAIARALAADPDILLADEPTAALDSTNGQSVIALLAGLAKSGDRAVVIVSHDSRVIPHGDRLVVLDDGCIVAPPTAVH